MKNVIKYKFDEKEGFLSVTELDGKYYAIVKQDAPKVETVKSTNELLISYEIKQPVYQPVEVKLSYDKALTQLVFEKLLAEKNLYFKALDDTLCVLEIAIK